MSITSTPSPPSFSFSGGGDSYLTKTLVNIIISPKTTKINKAVYIATLTLGVAILAIPTVDFILFVGRSISYGIKNHSFIEKAFEQFRKTFKKPENERRIKQITSYAAYGFRASLLGAVICISIPLIHYLKDSNNLNIQLIDKFVCQNTNICDIVIAPIRYEVYHIERHLLPSFIALSALATMCTF